MEIHKQRTGGNDEMMAKKYSRKEKTAVVEDGVEDRTTPQRGSRGDQRHIMPP